MCWSLVFHFLIWIISAFVQHTPMTHFYVSGITEVLLLFYLFAFFFPCINKNNKSWICFAAASTLFRPLFYFLPPSYIFCFNILCVFFVLQILVSSQILHISSESRCPCVLISLLFGRDRITDFIKVNRSSPQWLRWMRTMERTDLSTQLTENTLEAKVKHCKIPNMLSKFLVYLVLQFSLNDL